MRAELTLPPELVKEIAKEVADILKPLLSNNGKYEGEDTLLTTKEAGRLLKVSKGQIYQWVNNSQHSCGDFPYYKAGKLLRFSKKALLQWLEKR
ncbi:MAG: helix-turn-helix domain-containing protein [Nitrospinae bacterium]|nr:helix-turn-helix domain-containing protein [Nitrospinota bacterium]